MAEWDTFGNLSKGYVVLIFNKNVRIAEFFIIHCIWVLILVSVERSVMINCLFQLLRGHDDHVITCLEFCGSRVVSGSDDNTLKVWSVITGKVCNHSHTFSVACLINSSSLIDKCTICYTWNTVKYILFACNKYLRVSQLTLPQLPDIYRQWTQNALLEINIKKQPVLACKKLHTV